MGEPVCQGHQDLLGLGGSVLKGNDEGCRLRGETMLILDRFNPLLLCALR